jgi:hypothetical protein
VPWIGELPPKERGHVFATPGEAREIEDLEITLISWDIYERYGSMTSEHDGEFLCTSFRYRNRNLDEVEAPVPIADCNGVLWEGTYVMPMALLRDIPAGQE